MTIFFIIVIFIILVGYFIGKSKPTKSSSGKTNNSTRVQKEVLDNKVGENLLYKKKGIKTFDLKGMYYRKLDPTNDSGSFIGFAKCENNKHDTYAVGIYNEQNKLLGYTPKGNKRLNTSLTEWHKGRVPAWGFLRYDNYDKKWYGTVNFPIGYTLEQIEKVKNVLTLQCENELQIGKKEKQTERYFEILKRHQEIKKLLEDLKNPEEIYYSFPKNLIPTISNHLEKEKNWEKLIELEQHLDLINELSEKFKETTLRRINSAKANVA
jgi:hypothetical protein